jgi:hypothetical protein
VIDGKILFASATSTGPVPSILAEFDFASQPPEVLAEMIVESDLGSPGEGGGARLPGAGLVLATRGATIPRRQHRPPGSRSKPTKEIYPHDFTHRRFQESLRSGITETIPGTAVASPRNPRPPPASRSPRRCT